MSAGQPFIWENMLRVYSSGLALIGLPTLRIASRDILKSGDLLKDIRHLLQIDLCGFGEYTMHAPREAAGSPNVHVLIDLD